MESQQRLATNPDDVAAAREPLMAYFNTHPPDSIPKALYMMLGELWYVDQENGEHLETANWVYETAYEIYPDEKSFLLQYALTTYNLEQYENAAALFEDYYYLDESHDVQLLETAAGMYTMAGNEEEAQRILSQLADMPQTSEPTEETWANLPISDEAPVLISDVDTPPKVLKKCNPRYPDDLKENKIEGKVRLRFVVDTDGYVKEPEIVEATPADLFDEAAMEAIVSWKFQPAIKDGMRVACIFKVITSFSIE